VGPRAQLEQALRASFAREDLAVYADLLLAEGDPRGELIALDLDPHPTPAWQARRREVIEGWLGHAVASVSHHLIRLGFIPVLVADLDVRVDVDLRSIVRYLETTERVRALGARAAWTRFWDTVAELAGHDPAPFPFAVLDEALAACSDDIEDEAPRWAELRHQLRIARDRVAAAATVQLQRYWLV